MRTSNVGGVASRESRAGSEQEKKRARRRLPLEWGLRLQDGETGDLPNGHSAAVRRDIGRTSSTLAVDFCDCFGLWPL